MIELHAIVRGQVQGVGFRATVRHYAAQLGLRGIVRNLPDGNVEIYAQGRMEDLEKLIAQLKRRVGLIAVESVTTNFYPIKEAYDSFSIVH